MTCTGHAFLNSSHTGIVTVIVRVQDTYEGQKYYFLAIKDWSDEQTDIQKACLWGNTLPNSVGDAILAVQGSEKHIRFKNTNNINLRKRNG